MNKNSYAVVLCVLHLNERSIIHQHDISDDKGYQCHMTKTILGDHSCRYVTDHERRTHGHHRSEDMNLGSGDSNEKRLECQLCYTLFESKE